MGIVINNKLYNLNLVKSIEKCYKEKVVDNIRTFEPTLSIQYEKTHELIKFKTVEDRDETFEKIVKIFCNN